VNSYTIGRSWVSSTPPYGEFVEGDRNAEADVPMRAAKETSAALASSASMPPLST
jgi:hypothetical protein